MKIVLFNVRYSANLGDGVIAECLEGALRQEGADKVLSLDLAGRRAYGAAVDPARGAAIRLLAHLPPHLRRRLVRARLARFLERSREAWRQALEGADLAVIGGGNLFQDADLNFPLKISAALDAARSAGVPVAVHAVGVAPGWSGEAAALFSRIRANEVRHVALRDEASRRLWQAGIGDLGIEPATCRDPGLLAADIARPMRLAEPPARRRIGLGVTHPMILAYHATGAVAGFGSGARAGAGFYRDLALALVGRGERVTAFTNGAAEDAALCEALRSDPALAEVQASGDLVFAPGPETPGDLVTLIGGFKALVAHRLHAGIVAYGLGVPHVGLAWDVKVESFFRSVGRERFVALKGSDSPAGIAALVSAACAEGIDPGRREAVIAATRRDIAILHAAALHPARRTVEVAA